MRHDTHVFHTLLNASHFSCIMMHTFSMCFVLHIFHALHNASHFPCIMICTFSMHYVMHRISHASWYTHFPCVTSCNAFPLVLPCQWLIPEMFPKFRYFLSQIFFAKIPVKKAHVFLQPLSLWRSMWEAIMAHQLSTCMSMSCLHPYSPFSAVHWYCHRAIAAHWWIILSLLRKFCCLWAIVLRLLEPSFHCRY